MRPQEQGRKPRVFLERTDAAVLRLCLGGAEHLRKSRPADDFPNLFEVFVQRHFLSVRGFNSGKLTKNFERRADAGKNEVSALDPLPL
jgi:hypothetical protein